MADPIRIANCSGFYGDRISAAREVVEGGPIDVLTGDWLAELRDPSKADAFRPYCHRWWLVVADRSIVRDGELPDGWSLMVMTGVQLRAVVSAELHEAEPMPIGMTAALLRATAKTASARAVPDVR